ncbi:unnamed protein product [Caenorhabditis nigoni]
MVQRLAFILLTHYITFQTFCFFFISTSRVLQIWNLILSTFFAGLSFLAVGGREKTQGYERKECILYLVTAVLGLFVIDTMESLMIFGLLFGTFHFLRFQLGEYCCP